MEEQKKFTFRRPDVRLRSVIFTISFFTLSLFLPCAERGTRLQYRKKNRNCVISKCRIISFFIYGFSTAWPIANKITRHNERRRTYVILSVLKQLIEPLKMVSSLKLSVVALNRSHNFSTC